MRSVRAIASLLAGWVGIGALLAAGVLLASSPALAASTRPATAPTTVPATRPDLPMLFIAGDSTANNHGIYVGWGQVINEFFDPKRLVVQNHAMAGRSSRTFMDEGRWQAIASQLRKGDFVLIQFGHNDSKQRLSMDRYTLPGLGDEFENSVDPKTKKPIVIRTFGYYMRKMIGQSLAAGVRPIVLSQIPRCKWSGGKIVRGEEEHGPWSEQLAREMHVDYYDVNAAIADRYDPIGQPLIKALYFPGDNTHTNLIGARFNAACVVLGILQLKDCALRNYLIADAEEKAIVAATVVVTPQAIEKAKRAATRPMSRPATHMAAVSTQPAGR